MARVISPKEWLSPELEVLECRVYRGPHLYSHTPMIRIQMDLGALEEWPSNRLPDFHERLVALLPGLAEHTCSTGRVGGFVERLQEGTWIGHVIEHVAIELQSMAGMQVTRGKTRSIRGKKGHYNVMYSYIYEEAGRCAGRLALDLVASLLLPPFVPFKGAEKVHAFSGDNGFDLNHGIAELKRIAQAEKLGPTAQSLVDEAERRGIPWYRLDDQSLIQFGTGRYRKLIRASITSVTSSIAVEMACDKELTKKILAEAGIPVPQGDVVRTAAGAVEVAGELGFPVVIKPLDGNHGRGVTTNIQTSEDVLGAFTKAQAHSKYLIVERYFSGDDYRALVVNGEVVAVAERVPAHVIGNGIDTIQKLIDEVNTDPRRGNGHENIMTRIKIDEKIVSWLARSGLTLETVPAAKERIILASTANLSTGGTAIDRTDHIHPDNALMAKRAALLIGLDIAGIDLILPDISRSWRETGGGIVEVNAAPGFRMHLCPSEGQPRNVAKPVLSALFPAGEKTQIPVVAITGTNGKSTTVRMLAHILRQAGLRVGYTSTSGVYVNDDCIWSGDASGPKSARLLLRDPSIDIAILETARGGILREGLGVMDCDVGAVLNVTEDHLGLAGIETVEDLAAVKSVVAESVHSQGVSVLNADDLHASSIARYAGGKICYFSLSAGQTSLMQDHLAQGGCSVTREYIDGKAYIILHQDGMRIPVIAVNDIPATYAGSAVFNIENAMAATAIANGLKIDTQIIHLALSSFNSSFEQNPGRFNVYDGHGFRVIMDYAHNPAALQALFKIVRDMSANYLRVIGNVSMPGDRRDEDIRLGGRIAGTELDLAIFSEKPDLRGRKEGEVHALLMEGAGLVGSQEDNMVCVPHEFDAIQLCLEKARPGDLVVLLSGHPEITWKQVLDFKPQFPERREQQPIYEERVAHA